MEFNLLHHKTATCTRDKISNVPTVNTINRRGVFACTFITSLNSPIYNLDKQIANVFCYNTATLPC